MSVLLPLQDERQAGVECVRAWTSGQDAAPESFEILAIAPGEDRQLERSVRPLLRAHDRWLLAPRADEYEAFNLGAREARGEFLFITEAHCVPEPDCLAAMLRELDRTGAPGVRGASVPEARGALGMLERDAFEDALAIEKDPTHWRKVLIHSLAISRDTYLNAGGLAQRYGDFAPWPLAIALHSGGQRLVFSPRPRVRHVYDGDLRQLGAHVRSWGQGEMRYRSEVPLEISDRYLEPAAEWEQRLQYTREGALRALRAALSLRHPGTLVEVCRHLAVAFFGPRAAIATARMGAWWAALRARTGSDPNRRRRSFVAFWRLTSRRGRLEALAEASLGEAPSPPAVELVNLSDSLAGNAIGFHHAESLAGEGPHRWTAPLALLRVQVPGVRRSRARLALHPLTRPEKAPPARPRVAVDNRIVAATVSEESIEFEIDPGERWIAIACSPMRPRRYGVDDPRALGVPVRSLTLEPA
jgi:Glycosyl transferase family 2